MLEFNHILQSDYSRNPDNEFPKQPVAEFISSWIGDLINLHGDMELIVSLDLSFIQNRNGLNLHLCYF